MALPSLAGSLLPELDPDPEECWVDATALGDPEHIRTRANFLTGEVIQEIRPEWLEVVEDHGFLVTRIRDPRSAGGVRCPHCGWWIQEEDPRCSVCGRFGGSADAPERGAESALRAPQRSGDTQRAAPPDALTGP